MSPAVLVPAALLVASLARGGSAEERRVVGFSDDGRWFAFYAWGVRDGTPRAELVVLEVASGSREARWSRVATGKEGEAPESLLASVTEGSREQLASLQLGRDPGVELYRSGTGLRTSFTLSGVPCELRLSRALGPPHPKTGAARERVALRLSRGGRPKLLYSGLVAGTDFSLNSVLVSADGRGLAVFLRHSVPGWSGPDRRYLVATARP